MLGRQVQVPTRFDRGVAFTAGLSFAMLPAIGPFIALLAVSAGRFELQRSDRWWWLASVLLGAPFLFTGSAQTAILTVAQILAVWILFRTAAEVRRSMVHSSLALNLGAGLILGLGLMLALGLTRIDGFQWKTSLTMLDAVVWTSNPTIFGHSMLVLSALFAVVLPSPRSRALALALGGVGVLLSGAREAAFAWLLVSVGQLLLRRRGSRATRVVEWSMLAIMFVAVSGLGSFFGLGRTGYLTNIVAGSAGPNIFRGTEVANADWWHSLGVTYRTRTAQIDDHARTAFIVTKIAEDPWSRLQQFVTLQPGVTYTISAALQSPNELRPGLDGWGQADPDEAPAVLSATLDTAGLSAGASGPIRILHSDLVDLERGWRRASITFLYEGDRPVVWYAGVVVDRTKDVGTTVTFGELQLTMSDGVLPYVPGIAERGVTSLMESRYYIWRDASEAFVAKPWFGWGPLGLPAAIEAMHPDGQRVRPIASHSHNMLLDVLVKQGVTGALGLLLLSAILALHTVQQRDRAMAVVLLAVLVLNTLDATLLSGEVIYALAAVLGWRSVSGRAVAQAETGLASASAVRVVMVLTDAVTGALAIAAAILVAGRFDPSISLATNWSTSAAYASTLWPVMAAWSGLHPGYGRPAHDELARSVRSAAAATLLLGFSTLLLPDAFDLSATVLVLTGLFSMVLLPLLRTTTKQGLHAMRLWGRPVVLLGTSPEAERTARYLLRHPGIGLHPVAVFGNKKCWTLDNLPVTGDLEHTWAFLEAHNIRHVIVIPDAAAQLDFDYMLVRANRQLRFVQYLPDLRGLPTNSVAAAPLGTALGLEVRNQLASGTNRAVKRVIDVLGAAVLLAMMGLPLGLIALAIRLDSRGSPFYLSPRIGRYGRTFMCVKFRTMHVDADERLHRLLATDSELHDEYEHYHKLANDPRVTRIGRLLRRGSIDELPQVWNVLRGDMSLVGPRPYLVRELNDMSELKDLIFLARPGMTGYWQTEARNDVSFEERQVMEAHYVRNWSVWWDIEILLRTPAAVRSRTGK